MTEMSCRCSCGLWVIVTPDIVVGHRDTKACVRSRNEANNYIFTVDVGMKGKIVTSMTIYSIYEL